MLRDYKLLKHVFLMCQQRECVNNAVPYSQRCSVERAINFSMEGYKCWDF
jgi:hypothetical protein